MMRTNDFFAAVSSQLSAVIAGASRLVKIAMEFRIQALKTSTRAFL